MADIPVLINGNEYSAVDVKVTMAGVPVFGIAAINAEENQDKEDYYGLGSDRPVGRRRGVKKASGSITLYPVEIEAIQKAAPNHDILDIAPFDIIMVAVPKNSDNILNITLKNCEFMKNGRSFNVTDTTTETELPLILSHIKW